MCLWLWKTNDNYKSAIWISRGYHIRWKSQGRMQWKFRRKFLKKVEHLKTTIIPNDVHVEITRNYGETAADKVNYCCTWVSLF
jgi:hypothetical protein